MSIDIERILLELEILPKYDTQLSLQVTKDKKGGEGRLNNLPNVEEDFGTFAYDLPYTNSIISELKMYRTRVMRLRPKTCYSYHVDLTKRIHIPLITNNDCFMIINDELYRYPADGNYYITDTTKKHTFVNTSHDDRIHIVGCYNDL